MHAFQLPSPGEGGMISSTCGSRAPENSTAGRAQMASIVSCSGRDGAEEGQPVFYSFHDSPKARSGSRRRAGFSSRMT